MSQDQLASLFEKFWHVIISNNFSSPNFTDVMRLTEAIQLKLENKKYTKQIAWLNENTHKEVESPISIVEFMLFKNWMKGTNYEVDIEDKSYTLSKLFYYGNEMIKQCVNIVTELTKNYSFEIEYKGEEEGMVGDFGLPPKG